MEIHYESSLLSYVGKTWTPHLKAPTEDIQDVAGGTARKRVVFNGVGIEGAATDDNSLLQGSAIYLASLSFLFVGSAAITSHEGEGLNLYPQVTTLLNPGGNAFVSNQAGKVFDMRDGMNDKGQMTLQAPTTQGLFLYADPPARYLVNTAALDGADATYSLKGCAVNSHDTPSSFSDWASSVTPSCSTSDGGFDLSTGCAVTLTSSHANTVDGATVTASYTSGGTFTRDAKARDRPTPKHAVALNTSSAHALHRPSPSHKRSLAIGRLPLSLRSPSQINVYAFPAISLSLADPTLNKFSVDGDATGDVLATECNSVRGPSYPYQRTTVSATATSDAVSFDVPPMVKFASADSAVAAVATSGASWNVVRGVAAGSTTLSLATSAGAAFGSATASVEVSNVAVTLVELKPRVVRTAAWETSPASSYSYPAVISPSVSLSAYMNDEGHYGLLHTVALWSDGATQDVGYVPDNDGNPQASSSNPALARTDTDGTTHTLCALVASHSLVCTPSQPGFEQMAMATTSANVVLLEPLCTSSCASIRLGDGSTPAFPAGGPTTNPDAYWLVGIAFQVPPHPTATLTHTATWSVSKPTPQCHPFSRSRTRRSFAVFTGGARVHAQDAVAAGELAGLRPDGRHRRRAAAARPSRPGLRNPYRQAAALPVRRAGHSPFSYGAK